MPRRLTAGFLLCSLLTHPPAHAEPFGGRDGHTRLSPPRAAHAPAIDGRVDDAEWSGAAVLTDFTENRPVEGRRDTLGTTCLVMYDHQNLYVAFRCQDVPEHVQAPVVGRDNIFSGDWAGVVIDSYHDRQRSYFLGANPRGIQVDGINQEGVSTDLAPDFQFTCAGRLTPEGWSLEMAIPFKSLRFPVADKVTFGFNAVRDIRRSGAHLYWAPIQRSIASYHQQLGDLQDLQGIRPGRNVELNPYVTGSRFGDRGAGAMQWANATSRQGLGIKLGLTSALTLDAAITPDFSQVEADAGVVDVNQRYAIFFAEKRPFFLEGADIFNTPLSLVYTRRIADPRYGVKLTGKAGKTAIGLLQASDQFAGNGLPGVPDRANPYAGHDAQFTVARARHDFNDRVSVGALVTSREHRDAYDRVGSLDGRLTFRKSWSVAAQTVASTTRDPDFRAAFAGPDSLQIANTRPSLLGLTGARSDGTAEHVEVHYGSRTFEMMSYVDDMSRDFRADAGFISRPGVIDVFHWFAVHHYPSKATWYQSLEPRLEVGHTYDNGEQGLHGRLVDAYVRPLLVARLPQASTEFGGGVNRLYTYYAGRAFNPRWRGFLQGQSEYFRAFRPYLFASYGSVVIYDEAVAGRSFEPDCSFDLRVNERLDGTLHIGGARIVRAADGTRYANAFIPRLRVGYQFNREVSVRWISEWFGQRRYDTHGVAAAYERSLTQDVLLSYLLRPGTVVYVGYGGRLRSDGEAPLRAANHSLFVKASYLWQL